jgi:hypothetical protein
MLHHAHEPLEGRPIAPRGKCPCPCTQLPLHTAGIRLSPTGLWICHPYTVAEVLTESTSSHTSECIYRHLTHGMLPSWSCRGAAAAAAAATGNSCMCSTGATHTCNKQPEVSGHLQVNNYCLSKHHVSTNPSTTAECSQGSLRFPAHMAPVAMLFQVLPCATCIYSTGHHCTPAEHLMSPTMRHHATPIHTWAKCAHLHHDDNRHRCTYSLNMKTTPSFRSY